VIKIQDQIALEGLLAIKSGDAIAKGFSRWRREARWGICANLDRWFSYFGTERHGPRLGPLFTSWGLDPNYPVVGDIETARTLWHDPDACHIPATELNEWLYEHTGDMWAGDYGSARMALLDRLIAHFEGLCK
jgi:hypothetical protein